MSHPHDPVRVSPIRVDEIGAVSVFGLRYWSAEALPYATRVAALCIEEAPHSRALLCSLKGEPWCWMDLIDEKASVIGGAGPVELIDHAVQHSDLAWADIFQAGLRQLLRSIRDLLAKPWKFVLQGKQCGDGECAVSFDQRLEHVETVGDHPEPVFGGECHADSPSSQIDVMHPEEVKVVIRKRFGSVSRFCAQHEFSKCAVSDLLRGRKSARVRDAVEAVLKTDLRSPDHDTKGPAA
ncbi:hypothetical protein AAG594_03005 [Citromicrobium bathyomarinum]